MDACRRLAGLLWVVSSTGAGVAQYYRTLRGVRCRPRRLGLILGNSLQTGGMLPSTEAIAEMGKYNEQLVKAGVLLAAEGLHPTSKGARVKFSGSNRIPRQLARGIRVLEQWMLLPGNTVNGCEF